MLGRLRRLLGDPWFQRAILVVVVVVVFWDGIWAGVARSDQIFYLHHISQYDSLWDILSHSPSWNRTTPDPYPDLLLYRPVLYLLLGSFYYLFRYNFAAWQIASLSLHIVVVLGVHLLLLQGRLKQTPFPLLIALLFGTAFFGSELVLWNHIVGYLLFCALEVYAVYFFLRFLRDDGRAFLIACGALSLIAEFTYEAGALINLLFAAALFSRSLAATVTHTSARPDRLGADRWSALLFLLSALLLPIASLIDLRARGFALALNVHGAQTGVTLLQAAQDAVLQIAFWLSTWLAPSVYHCTPLHRAICGVSVSGLTALRLVNLLGLALLVVGAIVAYRRRLRAVPLPRDPLVALAFAMLFLFGYSMIIAVGRTVPKGLMYILQANIYYSYIAILSVCVGVALATAVGPARGGSPRGGSNAGGSPVDSATAPAPAQIGRRLVPALAALAFANAWSTHELARRFRYDFAAPRQEVVDRVLAWQKRVGDRTQRYFTVSPSCRANDLIWWLDQTRVRKDSGWRPPITLADALWPDRSADLNAAKIYISRQSVDEIRCGEGTTDR